MSIALDYVRVSENLRVKRGCGKEKVKAEGFCRMCRRPHSVRPLTKHHLVPCRWFRRHPQWRSLRDCDPNLLPLCRQDHENIELSDRNGGLPYRRMLRRLMTQAEISFVIQVRGRDWLEARYPLR